MRHRPTGVAPSPSRLRVRHPVRPSAQGNFSPPSLSQPRGELAVSMSTSAMRGRVPAARGLIACTPNDKLCFPL